MRFREKTVTGIDIAEDRISIVVLKNGDKGPQLVKSDVLPMPEGAVKNGNIEDAVLLSKTMRSLKVRNRIWSKRAAVSLFARPSVIQMIDMPKQVPSNMKQFVTNEVKHCVILPGSDIVLDFCGVGLSRRGGEKKVLATSAETEKVGELVKVLNRAGFSVELIEPVLFSYLRAIDAVKITGKNASCVLVAIVRQSALMLCVLRNGVVDFVRTKELNKDTEKASDLRGWLGNELKEIQKYYSIEVADSTIKWEITVLADVMQLPKDSEGYLKSELQAEQLHIRTFENAYKDTPLADLNISEKGPPSPFALGLAMKLLTEREDRIKINLMPPQLMRAMEARRDLMITVNFLAVLLLIMVLIGGGPSWMADKIRQAVPAKKQLIEDKNTQGMIEQHRLVDDKLKLLSGQLKRISQISQSYNDVNWPGLLGDIGRSTPRSVRITSMSCSDGLSMQISGLALSNDAIYLFVESLEKLPYIKSVALLNAQEQNKNNGLMTYQLSCELNKWSIKEDDIG